MSEILIYTCCLQVYVALEEAGAQFIKYNLPLFAEGGDKPTWFSEKVNPLGTVCASRLKYVCI